MVELEKWFLPYVTADWPTSLSAWDMREDHIDKVGQLRLSGRHTRPGVL